MKFWYLTALTFLLLSLGPQLKIQGREVLWLPFNIIQSIPFVSGARIPSRYIIITMLSLGIIASYSIENIFTRLKNIKFSKILVPLTGSLLIILITTEYITIPVKITDLTPPNFYKSIAKDSENYAILEIPFGIHRRDVMLGREKGLFQYYQTVHQKKLLAGYISNFPNKIFDYYKENEFIKTVCFLQNRKEKVPIKKWSKIRSTDHLAKEFISLYDIRYIVLHKNDLKERAIRYLTLYIRSQLSGIKITDSNKLRIVEIPKIQENLFVNENLLLPNNEMTLTEGWSELINHKEKPGRWATKKNPKLIFPVIKRKDLHLKFDLELPYFVEKPEQILKIYINSSFVSEIKITNNSFRENENIKISKEKLLPGPNIISFKFKNLFKVKIPKNSHYLIGNTGIYSPVDIFCPSIAFGFSLKWYHSFHTPLVIGKTKYIPWGRGYHVLVIDENSGQVIDSQKFDSHGSLGESERMAGFIEKIERGRIVAAIVSGAGSVNLNQKAIKALNSIGAEKDISGKIHFAHSIIGVKGAKKGEALEKSDPKNAILRIGEFSNSQKVAAWFNKIEISTIDD